jgi:hypothetical protein
VTNNKEERAMRAGLESSSDGGAHQSKDTTKQ